MTETKYRVLVNSSKIPFEVKEGVMYVGYPPTDKPYKLDFVIDSKIKRIELFNPRA